MTTKAASQNNAILQEALSIEKTNWDRVPFLRATVWKYAIREICGNMDKYGDNPKLKG